MGICFLFVGRLIGLNRCQECHIASIVDLNHLSDYHCKFKYCFNVRCSEKRTFCFSSLFFQNFQIKVNLNACFFHLPNQSFILDLLIFWNLFYYIKKKKQPTNKNNSKLSNKTTNSATNDSEWANSSNMPWFNENKR